RDWHARLPGNKPRCANRQPKLASLGLTRQTRRPGYLLDGASPPLLRAVVRLGCELLITLMQGSNFTLGQILDVDEPITGPFLSSDQLIELDLHGQGILVLRALDEKDHEKGDDTTHRIHHQ